MAGDSGRMSGTIVAHRNGADETLYDVPVTADNSFFDVNTRLGSGETLDFIVGNNGDYTSGNTPIEVSIHAVGQEEKLNAIARTIVAARPDLVLLNEVCVWAPWFNGGVNQVETLATKAGMPYFRWAETTALGVGGSMAVGVLTSDGTIHNYSYGGAPLPAPDTIFEIGSVAIEMILQ